MQKLTGTTKFRGCCSNFIPWLKLSMREDETQFWREQFRAGGKQVMLLRPRQIWIPEAGVIVGMGV